MARPSEIKQQTRTRGRRSRSAFTLLELTVVMAVLGVVAVAASSMLGSHTIVGTLAARQQAELLASTLRTARSSAIAGQQPVSVAVHRDARLGIGYRTALASDPNGLLQPVHYLPEGVIVEWSSPEIVFQPYGMSDRSLSVSITGSASIWVLDVRSASGQVTLIKKE
jgi:prepilin-type N-terminal cleavage/methylation domain-containing protein